MDGQKKFSTGIQIGTVVVVIIIFGALYYYSKNMSSQLAGQLQNGQQTTTSTQQASSTKSTKTKLGASAKKSTAPTPEQSVTYDQAINTYGSQRIQFDPSCGVIPPYSNYLNNTKVMFDNRYEKGRWFYLDSKGYYLGPYGFKIVTLYSKILPHTVMIDCGTGKNNGQILLQ